MHLVKWRVMRRVIRRKTKLRIAPLVKIIFEFYNNECITLTIPIIGSNKWHDMSWCDRKSSMCDTITYNFPVQLPNCDCCGEADRRSIAVTDDGRVLPVTWNLKDKEEFRSILIRIYVFCGKCSTQRLRLPCEMWTKYFSISLSMCNEWKWPKPDFIGKRAIRQFKRHLLNGTHLRDIF